MPSTHDNTALPPFRETEFIGKLKDWHPAVVQMFQLHLICRRIVTLTQIKNHYELTPDGIAYLNATLQSLEFLSSSAGMGLKDGYFDSDLWKKYEQLVSQFNQDSDSINLQIISIDYDNPESLLSSIKNANNPEMFSRMFSSFRKRAVLLIDAYKEEFDFMEKSIVEVFGGLKCSTLLSLGPSINTQPHLRNELELILRSCQKFFIFIEQSLKNLRFEMESIEETGPFTRKAFINLLDLTYPEKFWEKLVETFFLENAKRYKHETF